MLQSLRSLGQKVTRRRYPQSGGPHVITVQLVARAPEAKDIGAKIRDVLQKPCFVFQISRVIHSSRKPFFADLREPVMLEKQTDPRLRGNDSLSLVQMDLAFPHQAREYLLRLLHA